MILEQSPFTLGPWGARAYHTRAAILAQVWTSVQLGIQKKTLPPYPEASGSLCEASGSIWLMGTTL